MKTRSFRRLILAGNLAALCLIVWQTAALADCSAGYICPTPDGCTPVIGSGYYACSTDGTNCCQYRFQPWTYTGSGCTASPCTDHNYTKSIMNSTCQGTGLCTGYTP